MSYHVKFNFLLLMHICIDIKEKCLHGCTYRKNYLLIPKLIIYI